MNRPTPNAKDRSGIRINLTVPVEVAACLDRMGAVTGAGRATIVREFLTDALPHLSELALACEMAQNKNVDAFKVMADTLKEAVSQGDQMVLEIRKANRAARRKKSS